MFRRFSLLSLFLLVSCVSLDQVVSEKVRIGMTKDQFCSAVINTFLTSDPCYSHINASYNLPNSYYSYSPLKKTEILGINDNYFVFKNVNYKVGYGDYPPKNGGTLILVTRNIQIAREAARTAINPISSSGQLQNCRYPANSYVWDNCYGEITFEGSGSYQGEWKNNKMTGQGTYFWEDGGKYVGEWKNSNRHGKGTHVSSNGTKYVGVWKDNIREGKGTIVWKDGDKYEGEWKNNQRTGQGTYFWKDGAKYVGEWKSGNRHGKGTHVFSSGSKYVGEYKDNENDGYGTITFASGGKFQGIYRKGKRIRGKTFYANGNLYDGEYDDSNYEAILHGEGAFTWIDGDKFIGTFNQGEKVKGAYYFKSGSVYEGDWLDNQLHGQGKYIYADGKTYEGEFKKGTFHGYGVHKSKDGSLIYSGNWVEGKREGESEAEEQERLERQEQDRIERERKERIERERREQEQIAAKERREEEERKAKERREEEERKAKERKEKIDKLYERDWNSTDRELILAVQQLLKEIGYSLKADGKVGINTRTAVKAFQQDAKIRPVDGKITEKLLIQLQRHVSNKPAVQQLDLRLYNQVSSGSGVLINKEGHIVTNEHVIDGCSLLTTGNDKPAILIKADSNNDIAIIKTSDTEKYIPLSIADNDPELGEKIFVAGYPLNFVLENLNFTSGSVSSEAGLLQNINQFQFSAPIQPGSSGGPILNEYGGVVGIAVSTLSTKKFEEFTESLVQNINYGIKKSSLESLLELSDIEYEEGNANYFRADDKQVAQIAKSGAILIKCWKEKE